MYDVFVYTCTPWMDRSCVGVVDSCCMCVGLLFGFGVGGSGLDLWLRWDGSEGLARLDGDGGVDGLRWNAAKEKRQEA